MIERPDCDALLAGELGQWLAAQQGLRDATRAKIARRRKLSLIAAAVVAVLAFVITQDAEATLYGGIIVGVVGFGWAQSAGTPVIRAIKAQMNQSIARALGLEYALDYAPGEEWERAKRFSLLPSYDKESFEDCWTGTLGALPFHSFEGHCQEWQGSGKNRRLVTVFRGSVMAVAFTRRFHGTTVLDREKKHRKWFGGEKEEIELGGMILSRCEMVDPRFEDRFTVWGTDPVEARYLVHPEYIERLVKVEEAFAGKNIRALFCGGDLLVLVETGDQFESGSLKATDDRARLQQTIDQFGALADLAAHLNEAPRGNYTAA